MNVAVEVCENVGVAGRLRVVTGCGKLQLKCVCPGILSGECDVVGSGLGKSSD